MSLKDSIKHFSLKKCRVSFTETMQSLQANGKMLPLTVLAAFVVMLLVCLAVFFASVKAPEQVMVPNLEGKSWSTAMLEMEEKELYPKIQLRYTDSPADEGKVLAQNPGAGAIVKAGTRVTLTISRGVIIDHVESYLGMKVDDVRLKLQTMFTGSARPLIVLANPVYKPDTSEAGTILEQDPPEGTMISEPVTLQLVVSRGPEYEQTRVPQLVGKSIAEVLSQISNSRLVFDFTAHTAGDDERAGTVTAQQEFDSSFVKNYTHVGVEIALSQRQQDDPRMGLFSETVTQYPYPVTMTLDAVPADGARYTLVTLRHTGGNVTIPYAVPHGTELVFSIEGREIRHIKVN
ncbi:MAG: PASTA domain-containing protein [Treponemataceae bacterium]|nr:PASTA domain-containing protein [Treponemataceae bacterium]